MGHLNLIDRCLGEVDKAIRTIIPPQQRPSQRNILAHCSSVETLSPEEKKQTARLMRVNHTGEVCAQALYQGQALTAKMPEIKIQLKHAADEENEHLAWCEQRLKELDSQVSVLNPIWYLGSLCLGAAAGLAGDAWSLGFVAETEYQVSEHLEKHLKMVPQTDQRTHTILQQMHTDEAAHASMAKKAGAYELPTPIKACMRLAAKLMTKTSYYL